MGKKLRNNRIKFCQKNIARGFLDDLNFNLEVFTEAIADSTKTGILTMSKLGDEKNQSLIKETLEDYLTI